MWISFVFPASRTESCARRVSLGCLALRPAQGVCAAILSREGCFPMSISSILPARHRDSSVEFYRPYNRMRREVPAPMPLRFSAQPDDLDTANRHAELFYLQKQIQSQTQMVVVLEDGERIEGCIEWYDRNAIKVRGRGKTLIYKSSIKYMYKQGDTGQQ